MSGSGRVAALATRVYGYTLKVYPRSFASAFAAEMHEVFALAAADAAQHGLGPLTRLLLRELGDLPVNLLLEHIYTRRKHIMQLLGYNTEHDLRRIRWIARGLSLLFSAIILATAFLATEVTPAAVVLTALTLAMLAAWRWERLGGLLTMIGSPLPFFAVLYMASGWGGYDLDTSGTRFFTALAVGLALTLATFIVGWLFVSVAQHTALATTPPAASAAPSWKQVLAYLAVVLLVILLLLVSLVAAPFGKVETLERGVRPGEPQIQVIETVVVPPGE